MPYLGDRDRRQPVHLRRVRRTRPDPASIRALHEVKLTAVDASDSESPHPAEPDQTFDGLAALYSATASTTQLIRHVVRNGGAASTTYIAAPLAVS